ncbi:MAG: peptidoglycan-binding protein [Pusillimonas sp.]|nr:peptidoglycan-binding protein [Pusillimonas sp.]MBC41318.1 peptidoglycan-binding protein [Pusillimonas sp.]HCP77984.1 peptidoglycan-binding protein [Pusillimonas sp.]|tara:strand:+ start:79294 stop:80094 length:801 start_codon:yes stop_codon:yes gene_type:complete
MIIRLNDVGAHVGDLERRLYMLGYKVQQDNIYDQATQAVVRQVQKRAGIVVDGIYGPKTEAVIKGQETGRLLRQSALVDAAEVLGVDLASVMAVNEVESRGLGFIRDNLPVILFERHIFWRQLVSHKIDPRPFSSKYPGVVSQARGGYAGGISEYTRLGVAKGISAPAAFESCSWGLFQIMGFHWEALEFESIDAFVAYQQESENSQLRTFVRFILLDKDLHRALKQKKWSTFARIYNGPAYAENFYDVKLARAYKRYCAELKEAA